MKQYCHGGAECALGIDPKYGPHTDPQFSQEYYRARVCDLAERLRVIHRDRLIKALHMLDDRGPKDTNKREGAEWCLIEMFRAVSRVNQEELELTVGE